MKPDFAPACSDPDKDYQILEQAWLQRDRSWVFECLGFAALRGSEAGPCRFRYKDPFKRFLFGRAWCITSMFF